MRLDLLKKTPNDRSKTGSGGSSARLGRTPRLFSQPTLTDLLGSVLCFFCFLCFFHLFPAFGTGVSWGPKDCPHVNVLHLLFRGLAELALVVTFRPTSYVSAAGFWNQDPDKIQENQTILMDVVPAAWPNESNLHETGQSETGNHHRRRHSEVKIMKDLVKNEITETWTGPPPQDNRNLGIFPLSCRTHEMPEVVQMRQNSVADQLDLIPPPGAQEIAKSRTDGHRHSLHGAGAQVWCDLMPRRPCKFRKWKSSFQSKLFFRNRKIAKKSRYVPLHLVHL